jgi:hypothetical protein
MAYMSSVTVQIPRRFKSASSCIAMACRIVGSTRPIKTMPRSWLEEHSTCFKPLPSAEFLGDVNFRGI